MIQAASKYSKLPSVEERWAAPVSREKAQAAADEAVRQAAETAVHKIPVLRKSARHDMDEAARQIHEKNQGDLRQRGCNLLIPKYRATMSQSDWRWRELREGGCLHAYLNRMRAGTKRRWQAVGRARANFKQNPKSDLQLLASVPAYDYFRWTRVDKDFFRDPKNLRALRRDNPHVTSVFV